MSTPLCLPAFAHPAPGDPRLTRPAQHTTWAINPFKALTGKPPPSESETLDQLRAGDAQLTRELTGQLRAILIRRGATPTEADDVVADLLADCFGPEGGRSTLLDRFSGRGSLKAFLTRTALNRLIDHKRRLRFRGELPVPAGDDGRDSGADPFDRVAGINLHEPGEDLLVDLLRTAILNTFASCDPEELLMLRMVAIHRVPQAAVARMFSCSQSRISRTLTALTTQIRRDTLAEVQRIDPWLELEWEDFLSLCEGSIDLFARAAEMEDEKTA